VNRTRLHKQPKVEVDARCCVKITLTLGGTRDDLWHEYLGGVEATEEGRPARDVYDLESSANTVTLTVKDQLVDRRIDQSHGVSTALEWVVGAFEEADERRQEARDRQVAMQEAADARLRRWWDEYIRSLG
jgi:hypothetical protein